MPNPVVTNTRYRVAITPSPDPLRPTQGFFADRGQALEYARCMLTACKGAKATLYERVELVSGEYVLTDAGQSAVVPLATEGEIITS